MYKCSLRGFAAAIVLILLATAAARADSVAVVTSSGGLSANDTIVWSQLGADATVLTATPGFTSTQGLTGSVTLGGPNSLVAVVCPETLCSWNLAGLSGFSAGDSLIWTADTGNSGNGPLTLNFTSKNVSGAGALIQSDGPAQFTANIEAFNGGTSLGSFPVTSDVNGDEFVPEDQDKKIALIGQAAAELTETLNPKDEKALPAPTDQEVVSSLEGASNFLSVVMKRSPGTKGVQAAERLSNALANLAKASPEARARASDALVTPLKMTLSDLKLGLNPEKITLDSLPPDLVAGWKGRDGQVRVSVSPKGDSEDNAVLRHFVEAVTAVAPNATGEAIGIQKAGDTIVNAFIQAAILALVSIALLLWITLKRASDVALTLFPLLLACVVTLELCVIFDMPLNFANIIALPLLLGVGVAFKIYYIMAWREGKSGLLASPLTRAVFFSGMTTAVAFGSLWLSNHPGTSSMGKLLALSLVSTMAAAVLFQPLLMGPPREVEEPVEEETKGKAKGPAYLPTPEHTA